MEDVKLTDQEIDKGLFPELGAKTVTIVNKQMNIVKNQTVFDKAKSFFKRTTVTSVEKWDVQITEMPVYYVKEFNKLLQPFYGLLGGTDVKSAESLAGALVDVKRIEKLENDLLEPAWYIVNYHAKLQNTTITKNDLEMNCAEAKLLEIIYTQLEVNRYTDFFKMLFQGLIATLAGAQAAPRETS
jgi:hypothetical protein